MIVLLLSLREVEDLIHGRADRALKAHLANACHMEKLLPDENLPVRVMLEQVEANGRDYLAVIREFETTDAADQAWSGLREEKDFELSA